MISKRIFDLVFSLLGILICSPLFVAIAVWIKFDSPGPVFFRQTRVGRLGQEFRIYKFRTMVENAESLGQQLTVANDQRITSSGQFLRKYKLDELPQLFNVLKGEMSFVGPRPEVPKYVAFYTPEQRQILEVSPGITDLASIHFRNENEILSQVSNPEEYYIQNIIPQKIALNQEYIKQASLGVDLKIIFQTIWLVMINRFSLENPQELTSKSDRPFTGER